MENQFVKAPAYQWYPDKAMLDTRRLSWEAKGVYRELLDTIWMQYQETCSIPNDDDLICAELGCEKDIWDRCKLQILLPHRPLMTVLETNRLFSPGLYKEREKQAIRREQLRLNGSKGGRPKNQKVILEKPNDNQKQSLLSPSPSLSLPPEVGIPPNPQAGEPPDGGLDPEPKKRKAEYCFEVPDLAERHPALDTPTFRERFQGWLDMRRELPKAKWPTVGAVKRALSMCAEWGHDNALRSLDQSTVSRWTGLFEVKTTKRYEADEFVPTIR